MRAALLDRASQRRALAEQVLLADELVERPRAHARGERPVDRRRAPARASSGRLGARTGRAPCGHVQLPGRCACRSPSVPRQWSRPRRCRLRRPAAHVGLLRELVRRAPRLDRRARVRGRNAACQLLPGPASTQLAIYCAQRVGGVPGALSAASRSSLPGRCRCARSPALALGERHRDGPRVGAGPAQRDRGRSPRPTCVLGAHSPPGGASRAAACRPASAAATLAGHVVLVPRRGCASWPGTGARRRLHAAASWSDRGREDARAGVDGAESARSPRRRLRDHPADAGDAVDRAGWMTDAEFVNAVACGQLTPGRSSHTVALVGSRGGRRRAARPPRIALRLVPSVQLGGDRLGAAARPAARALAAPEPAAGRPILGAAVPLGGARGVVAARCSPPPAALLALPSAVWRSDDGAARRHGVQLAGDRCHRSSDGLQDEADDVARAADPLQHRQPARQRAGVPGVAGGLPRGRRARVRAAGADAPERPNLVARLRGAADGPSLGFLSHVDTVLADAGRLERTTRGRATSHDGACGAAARST